MMKIVRSALTTWALAGAVSCGGARVSPPTVTETPSGAATNEPWSDGMGETAPNRFLEAKGMRFAYRAFGRKPGVPIVFLAPVGRNMDFWDPKLTDALAQGHLVVLFDNAGIGLSTGESPRTVAEIARNAETFIDALKELHMTDPDWVNGRVDLLGFAFGVVVAQQLAVDRPDLVERVVLAAMAPQGGGGRDADRAGRAFMARIDSRQKDPDAPVSSTTIAAQAAAVNAWGEGPAAGHAHLAALSQPVLVVDPDSAQGALLQYPERLAEHVSAFLRRR